MYAFALLLFSQVASPVITPEMLSVEQPSEPVKAFTCIVITCKECDPCHKMEREAKDTALNQGYVGPLSWLHNHTAGGQLKQLVRNGTVTVPQVQIYDDKGELVACYFGYLRPARFEQIMLACGIWKRR